MRVIYCCCPFETYFSFACLSICAFILWIYSSLREFWFLMNEFSSNIWAFSCRSYFLTFSNSAYSFFFISSLYFSRLLIFLLASAFSSWYFFNRSLFYISFLLSGTRPMTCVVLTVLVFYNYFCKRADYIFNDSFYFSRLASFYLAYENSS